MHILSDDFASMQAALEATGDYRVLRRLIPRDVYTPHQDQPFRIGVIFDVETTGLDTKTDEVIELGMVKFAYSNQDAITHIIDTYSSFHEPLKAIPAEVTELTGITPEMVAGHRVDPEAVATFVSDAAVIIAHNADFDRKFAERFWPIFVSKPWACSATQINWRNHGFAGSRLAYLLMGAGFFHSAHRAVDDCRALLEILALKMPKTDQSALKLILDAAREPTARIWAINSPYDLRLDLKKRGYRWNDGSDGRPKSWYVDVPELMVSEEIEYLRRNIYLHDVEVATERMTAMSRFSVRG